MIERTEEMELAAATHYEVEYANGTYYRKHLKHGAIQVWAIIEGQAGRWLNIQRPIAAAAANKLFQFRYPVKMLSRPA